MVNCVAVLSEDDQKVRAYNKRLSNKILEPVDILKKPITGNLYSVRKDSERLTIMLFKIHAFPVYWFLPILVFLQFYFSKLWTLFPLLIFLVATIPFTSSFWFFLYWLGLKKSGYKGKLRRISPGRAWGEYLGTN